MWHVRGELDVGQCCQKYVGASQCLWLGGLSRAVGLGPRAGLWRAGACPCCGLAGGPGPDTGF